MNLADIGYHPNLELWQKAAQEVAIRYFGIQTEPTFDKDRNVWVIAEQYIVCEVAINYYVTMGYTRDSFRRQFQEAKLGIDRNDKCIAKIDTRARRHCYRHGA